MWILKQKLKRKDLKITNMEHLLKALKEKEIVNDENHCLLDHNFGGTMAQEIFKNQVKNTATTSKHAMRYTNELKSFAVTLHYYSLKAYEFTQKILALPDPASIRAWGSSVQCEPGFLTEIMHLVGENSKQHPNMKDIALIVDGMALRKGIVWNPKTKRYVGTINYGTAVPEVEDDLATEALVFLIIGLKSHFKHPVVYFLQNKCSAVVQVQLIRDCISLLHDEGLCVHSLIFDGTYTNQYTAKQLGCRLMVNSFQSWFPHPTKVTDRIHVIFDACHMLKLMRNLLADYEEITYIKNGQLYRACWKIHCGTQQCSREHWI